MVRQWQELFYEKNYAGTPIQSPDYIKLGEAYGIPGRCITKKEDVTAALEEANNHDGPYILEFRVKEEVNVYPMVEPGEAIDNLMRRPIVQGPSGLQPAW
jgi:acetolactate synthase-1/2/3 large subunit